MKAGQYLTSIGEAMSNSFPERNKTTVLEAFETLFNKRDYAAAERFWSPNYIQHSAHIPAGRDGLLATTKSVLKRNAVRFAAAFLVALASFVAAPNAALAAAPQHHDQVPGFYRLKVGDLEVTALYDGFGVFDPHWLNGTKATMDGVVEALHEDPRMLDGSDEGFRVNTGHQLIVRDAAA